MLKKDYALDYEFFLFLLFCIFCTSINENLLFFVTGIKSNALYFLNRSNKYSEQTIGKCLISDTSNKEKQVERT